MLPIESHFITPINNTVRQIKRNVVKLCNFIDFCLLNAIVPFSIWTFITGKTREKLLKVAKNAILAPVAAVAIFAEK